MARHTFATTITLSQGMPIETVSCLLGHTNIKTTQIYAKITNEKISRDMSALTEFDEKPWPDVPDKWLQLIPLIEPEYQFTE